jgi:hypothetical protein
MPWVRQNGQHVFIRNNQPAHTTQSTSTDTQLSHTVDTGSLPKGIWCQWTGIPESVGHWAQQGAYGNLENAHTQVEIAEPASTCVAGVVVDSSKVKTDGIVLAYVIKKKRTLELSGLYATSENGVHIANTAIIQRGNFFVMARSKDDELETLISQFAELTG